MTSGKKATIHQVASQAGVSIQTEGWRHRTLQTGEVALHAVELGAGPIVLLLHKLSPFGDDFGMEQVGWMPYYLDRLAAFRRGEL